MAEMLPMTGTDVCGWPGVRGQVSPTCMLESFVSLGSLLVWIGLGRGCVSVCLCLCMPVSMCCVCVCSVCLCVCVFMCVRVCVMCADM